MSLPYVLKRPILTERSLAGTAMGLYTFEVDRTATKGQIKKAVENYFKVDVVSIRTTKIAAKRKRVGKRRQERVYPAGKKATVQLKKEQKIDLFEMESE